MIKNVYGTYIDTEKPVTGVTNLNSDQIPEWFNEEFYNAIDLNFEEYENELLDLHIRGLISHEEFESMLENYQSDITTYLLGDWIKNTSGQYEPDPDGEYSAIYDNNDNTLQIVLSKTTKRCNHCSPCFLGQADLDSDGDFLAYCLPD